MAQEYQPQAEAVMAQRRARALKRSRGLARWLDGLVEVPVLRTRVGLDAIIGLVPGIGDLASAGLSAIAIEEALRLRAPKRVVARMLGNIAVDFTVGLVPLAGDIFDIYWKANRRNLKLLEDWLARQPGAPS